MKKSTNIPVFDVTAKSYDEDFTSSAVGLLQRRRVYCFLKKYISNGKQLNILEINCGTGEDARWLAENGHTVMATDLSVEMIEEAKRKQVKNYRDLPLSFLPVPFNQLVNNFQQEYFDMIFSDFGGLNCIDETAIQKLATDASYLLKPGGTFIAVVMGRKCLWEKFYFLFKTRPTEAFRRLGKGAVPANVGGVIQQTYYFSPKEMGSLMKKQFSVKETRPVGLFIPPSYLNLFFSNKKIILGFMNVLDRIFSFSFLSDYADHYFIVFSKR